MTNQKLNNLLKDPRTNWKFIFIVVILGFLAGAGILGYYYWWLKDLETKLTELETRLPVVKPPEKVVEDETANWKTYRNEAYGYQIKFPEDWREYSRKWISAEGEMAISWSDLKNDLRSIDVEVTCKGDKTSEEWISGKPWSYEKYYRKLKNVTIEGIETVILEESTQDIGVSYRRKIVFIPRNNYVYIIKVPHPIVSDEDFELVLSTFKFIKIKEELLGWKTFWEKTKEKGCYEIYRSKCPFEEVFHFPDRLSIPFTEGDGCSTIGDFAEKNPSVHQVLLEGEGAIEDYYRAVWACRGEYWPSEAILVGYIDLTNDGEKDAIVMYRGGAAMRSHAVGVFQSKEGKYLKILDKDIPYSNFQIEKGQLIEIVPMYLSEESECCPSNHAHIYYKFIKGKFEVDKIIDDYGYNITEIYQTLRSCSQEEPED